MKIIKVYVQHDYVPILNGMKIRATDIIGRKVPRSGNIILGDSPFIVKKEKSGIIIIIASGSSGNIICDYLGSVKIKEEKNGKRKSKILSKN